MTIRRQLSLSYLGILLLLACNLLIYLWTDTKREAALEDLRRAIARQTLISSIQQEIVYYQKQVTLLSQGEGGLTAPSVGRTRTVSTITCTKSGAKFARLRRLPRRTTKPVLNRFSASLRN